MLEAASLFYRKGGSDSICDAIDKVEEVMCNSYRGKLPFLERYAHELARRAIRSGGVEAVEPWIRAAEDELRREI